MIINLFNPTLCKKYNYTIYIEASQLSLVNIGFLHLLITLIDIFQLIPIFKTDFYHPAIKFMQETTSYD